MKKKESTPVIKCPRCHASNLTSQSKCGKCGYIFPHARAKNSSFDPSLGAANTSSGGEAEAIDENIGVEGGGSEEVEGAGEELPPEPEVPKHLIGKGQSEGPLTSRGEWRQCPRCGADLKPDMKRCIKCGLKIK